MGRSWHLLLAAVAHVAAVVYEAPLHDYLSRPDLRAPQLFLDAYNVDAIAPGYLFLSPFPPEIWPNNTEWVNFDYGPMIYDNRGELVWSGANHTGQGDSHDQPFGTMGFFLCSYKGQPHLCYTHYTTSRDLPAHHDIVNTRYDTVRTLTVQGKSDGQELLNDLHEFKVYDTVDSAIITGREIRQLPNPVYHATCNVSISWVQSSVFQEVRLEDNDVLFQWDSFDHIPLEYSHCPIPGQGSELRGNSRDLPWDAVHLNSVDKDLWGNYYISARHTSTVYKVSGRDGAILWSIGEHGNIPMSSEVEGINATFGFQHDLRVYNDYPGVEPYRGIVALSLFDNANDRYDFKDKIANYSAGKVYLIDEQKKTAVLKEAYTLFLDPQHDLTSNQGSIQLLPNGNRLVGGGNIDEIIEWAPGSSEPVYRAHWGDWSTLGHKVNSYRSLRFDWQGYPRDTPTVFAFAPSCGRQLTSYVSWNGATEVDQWVLLGGATVDGPFKRLGSARRDGFETPIAASFTNYVFVVAYDNEADELGRSPTTLVSVLNDYGDPDGTQCGITRCERGFDYTVHAGKECPPVHWA